MTGRTISFPGLKLSMDFFRLIFTRSNIQTLNGAPRNGGISAAKLLQSGFTTLGSLLVLVLILGLVGHQAEIHETVIRQSVGSSASSLPCPVSFHTVDETNLTSVYLRHQYFQLQVNLFVAGNIARLNKTLQYLKSALYDDDIVTLHCDITGSGLKNNSTNEIIDFLEKFVWPHGPKEIELRIGGEERFRRVDSWWPSTNHRFALLLEEGTGVAPEYYKSIRRIARNLYFNPENYDAAIFGVGLEGPDSAGLKWANGSLFLHPSVSPKAHLLFPKPWKDFRVWLNDQNVSHVKGFELSDVYGNLAGNFGGNSLAESGMWALWLHKFIASGNYFSVYGGFGERLAFGLGEPSNGSQTEANGTVFEAVEALKSVDLWDQPKPLPRLDTCFIDRPITEVLSFPNFTAELSLVEPNATILLVDALGAPEPLLWNFVCHVSVLALRNVFFLTRDETVAQKLSQKGLKPLLFQGRNDSLRSVELKAVGGDGAGKSGSKMSLVFGRKAGFEKGTKAEAVELREEDEALLRGSGEFLLVEALISVSSLGFRVALGRPDVVWRKNPISPEFQEGVHAMARDRNGTVGEVDLGFVLFADAEKCLPVLYRAYNALVRSVKAVGLNSGSEGAEAPLSFSSSSYSPPLVSAKYPLNLPGILWDAIGEERLEVHTVSSHTFKAEEEEEEERVRESDNERLFRDASLVSLGRKYGSFASEAEVWEVLQGSGLCAIDREFVCWKTGCVVH